MPKLKTHKGVKSRFKKTGSGKIRRHRAGKRHLLNHKRSKSKRNMRKSLMTSDSEVKTLTSMLQYK